MLSNYEYRLKARASLGGSIFSSIWLLAVLALVIISALSSLVVPTAVGIFLIIGPLSLGAASIFSGLARGRGDVDLADLIKGFASGYVENLLLGILSGLYIFLWSLLFFFPGLVKAYAYSMIYFIKNDHPEYTWRQCLTESQRVMVGHKWKLFRLDLSFLGWLILGALCFGVGSFWVASYMQAAHAHFYESVR